MARDTFDVIVIGAGFGGSSCAGLMAKSGLDVLLVEQN
ncbi:MAG: FAD-binding protein, partial [Proteobacteria bacterium]|nr:FAD-binding protein [Pseudomonadota bacterium]